MNRGTIYNYATSIFYMLLNEYERDHNKVFIEDYLNNFCFRQPQRLRCMAIRKDTKLTYSGKTHTWEHVIPINYFKQTLAGYIFQENEKEGLDFINWYFNNAIQICIPKEIDRKLTGDLKRNMPDNWNWKTDSIWARYIESGIDYQQFIN